MILDIAGNAVPTMAWGVQSALSGEVCAGPRLIEQIQPLAHAPLIWPVAFSAASISNAIASRATFCPWLNLSTSTSGSLYSGLFSGIEPVILVKALGTMLLERNPIRVMSMKVERESRATPILAVSEETTQIVLRCPLR
jgi:hypothetical protein